MPDAKPTLSEASHEVQVNESRFVLGFPLLLLLLFFLRLLLGVLTMLLSLSDSPLGVEFRSFAGGSWVLLLYFVCDRWLRRIRARFTRGPSGGEFVQA